MSDQLWCMALPALITALLPPHIVPSIPSKLIVFGLLVYLTREIRLGVREYVIQQRALACGGRIAPRVHSLLPFGLSIIIHRLQQLATGTPISAVDQFQAFPKGTTAIRTRALGIEVILTRSHLDAKHILVTGFSNWAKSPNFTEAFEPFLGEGVFASDHRGLWSWHRALTKPHFFRERVADVAACEQHIRRVVIWLKKKAEAEELVDIQDVFSSFALTVGTQHLFGHRVDSLNDILADEPTTESDLDTTCFSQDFADAQQHCLKFMLLPSWVRRFVRALKLPNKSIEGVFKVVDGLIAKTDEKVEIPERDEDDDAEHLIEHLRREGCSPELLRFESLNIMLAAKDTTSSLLTSCIYELAGRDEIWGRLRTEAAGLNLLEDSLIQVEDIRKLKFLRAVINETLRLHPPVWNNMRRALQDEILPSGIFVPAGTDCRFIIREFQRNSETWGKDAEEFVPDRWMDGRQVTQSKDPFTYQPFSAGPRICLGQQFAYMVASTALVRLLLAFSRVELAGPSASREAFKEVPGVVLSVRGGLWVKFHK